MLIAQRWILACLRNRRFFSLDELNDAIAELLERLNTRPFQKLDGCRRSAFESIDRPAMKPLPRVALRGGGLEERHGEHRLPREYDDRLYSVPHAMVGAQVQVRATVSTVEILHKGRRVVAAPAVLGPEGHGDDAARSTDRSRTATTARGRPSRDRVVGGSRSGRRRRRGDAHPRDLPAPRGRLPLVHGADPHGKKYGPARFDAACRRALAIGSPTRKSVEMILKRGLEHAPVPDAERGAAALARSTRTSAAATTSTRRRETQ